ncbi:hypothetical protein DACRYDRAFT_23850 [Dacryopinax primogenitus]|uniref:Uncharacterized protein n=1 Tax=Dacryopinax primogenitus (strain DJM 731) TaxID=1858805 RepID=M5FUR5_DACPD|nr:uncharacterized protein DACRYDRAFT_23850 [Dacryopinax primogenitus]EJT99234.1 hypothetical protein DACRYDRAFT_23850 [Dacryopinax primogenitus]
MPLDSSPIAAPHPTGPHHPPARPNLKRQHSTIPTPPQTQKKRVSRARPIGTMGKVGKLVFPGQQPARKRARLEHSEKDKTSIAAMTRTMDVDETAHEDLQPTQLPFLNPLVERGMRTPSPPSTPVRKSNRVPPGEEDNPFLATAEEEERMLQRRRQRELSGEVTGGFGFANGEKTIIRVFRGVRQEYPNPFYNRPLNTEASQLPLSHPDYSPPLAAPPRLLFPPGSSKATVLADIERAHASQGKLRPWVKNVELPTPESQPSERRGLGLGLELVDEMDVDGDGDNEEVGVQVGRVVRMMPLVGRQGRENHALRSVRPIR